jgi:glucose/arabinose dehydrogenase
MMSVSDLYDNRIPQIHRIDLAALPQPYATPSVRNAPMVMARPAGAKLHVPPGFSVSIWAAGLAGPRAMAVAPNGDVFAVESGAGRVSLLRQSRKGVVVQTVFARGLNRPFGIAFYPPGNSPKYLYIADTDAVLRFPYHTGQTRVLGSRETVIPDLPAGGYNNHWTRRLLFSQDGRKLYISVGSAGNVDEEEPRRAAILESDPDGSDVRVYASGLRNPVGLAWNPIDGRLWTAVNERDDLGDDLVPDFATAVKPGGFYGWPYYYMGGDHDPRMPQRPDLKAVSLVPDVPLEAHCAALSILFYTAKQFPRHFWNDAFVAMHGSWNRSRRTGYKVVRLMMRKDGTATGEYDDFVWGWAVPGGGVWGRPVDLAVAPDGAMLISDDGSGTIWRVAYAPAVRR